MIDKPKHERIWLVPSPLGEGYDWCDCPTPSPDMLEEDAVEYLRADLVQSTKKEAT
jgi:hypothetical protein